MNKNENQKVNNRNRKKSNKNLINTLQLKQSGCHSPPNAFKYLSEIGFLHFVQLDIILKL